MENDQESQAIEDKDRDVVKRFRSIVFNKEFHQAKKSRAKKIAVLAVACLLGAALAAKIIHWRPRPEATVQVASSEEVIQTGATARLSADLSGQSALKQDRRMAPDKDNKESAETASDKKSRMVTKTPRFEKNDKQIAISKVVAPAGEKTSSTAANQTSRAGGISVAKIITCRSVADRRHLSAQKEFSVKKDGRVYVWMDVRTQNAPSSVRHVYFINGRRYCSIPLSVTCGQMRTWSTISLNNGDDVGKWRVEVVTDGGENISKAEFTVIP
jgi:hypothetical protein